MIPMIPSHQITLTTLNVVKEIVVSISSKGWWLCGEGERVERMGKCFNFYWVSLNSHMEIWVEFHGK